MYTASSNGRNFGNNFIEQASIIVKKQQTIEPLETPGKNSTFRKTGIDYNNGNSGGYLRSLSPVLKSKNR